MTYNNIYYSLWEKFLPVIAIQMKNSKNGEKEIKLFRSEFAALGKKPISEFLFSLDILNGKIVSANQKSTPVARDLFDKLSADPLSKYQLANQHFNFSMGKDFVLKIQNFPLEPVLEEQEAAVI